mgnify:CR=1 FL=1
MESITLNQVGVAVAFVVSLISGIGFINQRMKKWIKESMQEQLDAIESNINELHKRIDDVDQESCKNYLVSFLSDTEKGEWIDDIEKERFWEQYEHYTSHGGNSYIKRKVELLKSENKL